MYILHYRVNFAAFIKGKQLCDFLFAFYSEKGSTLKGKNLQSP